MQYPAYYIQCFGVLREHDEQAAEVVAEHSLLLIRFGFHLCERLAIAGEVVQTAPGKIGLTAKQAMELLHFREVA